MVIATIKLTGMNHYVRNEPVTGILLRPNRQ